MNPIATTRVATRALLRNKMRSFLTTLGIVIGVGAVIAMVAIGEGAKAQVQASFDAMGNNLLIVTSGASSAGGARGGFGSQPTLTWEDYNAIRSQLPAVHLAAPQLQGRGQLVSEDQNWSTQITGTSPDFFPIRNWRIARGAAFTQADMDGGAKVVVLGGTVSEQLFGANVDPVGMGVRIKNIPFTVIGVLADKGQSPWGQDYDDIVVVPSSTYQAKVQGGLSKFLAGAILVSAISAEATQHAEEQITSLLRERHRVPVGTDNDFQVRNLAEVASARQESTETLTLLLASIAAVSLLVGGIGIMNIMLVSVTERTREIGVRMAVGAKPRHILAQFLVEALALSIMGGLIGVALGLLAARELAARFQWPTLVRPDIIIIAVAFSAAVGVIFGLYPARKASRLDPIDALRYE
jgi:putative ABC transport system permease protein